MKNFFKNETNFFRYVLPVLVILALFVAGSMAATTLQSWQNTAGTGVANIDSNGSLNISSTGSVNFNSVYSTSTSASVPAITAGSANMTQPFAGTVYKKVIISLSSYTSSGSVVFTFPTAFASTPSVVYSTMSGGSIGALTTTTTSEALATSSSAATGNVILEGP